MYVYKGPVYGCDTFISPENVKILSEKEIIKPVDKNIWKFNSDKKNPNIIISLSDSYFINIFYKGIGEKGDIYGLIQYDEIDDDEKEIEVDGISEVAEILCNYC